MYLIECKRYRENVGVSVARELHGVVQAERANKGIIVTTAGFSQPAKEFIEKVEWQLEGADLDVVVDWLEQYQTGIMRKHAHSAILNAT